MKIPVIQGIKAGLGITAIAGTILLVTPKSKAHAFIQQKQDTFEYTQVNDKTAVEVLPTIRGTNDSVILSKAPSPMLTVQGEKKTATIVVDISKNILYHYDVNGKPTMAYLVASGKTKTPTKEIISIVSHVETYPYKSAPAHTKRRRSPGSFGPRAIILDKLDTLNNERISSGQFIHGNNDVLSLGKYRSGGCIRMDNEVIKELAKKVKRGDLVIFKRFKLY